MKERKGRGDGGKWLSGAVEGSGNKDMFCENCHKETVLMKKFKKVFHKD